MEHIPIPHSPEFARPIIPVLIPQQDDSLDFDGFPIRYGFDPDRLLRGDFSEHSPPRTAAFLQTWLYFGTLRAVLGHEFGAAQSFIRAEGGFENGIVTTIALEDLVCKRANHLRALFYDQDPKTSSSSVQVAWETYFGMAGCLRKLLAFCMLATVPVDTRDSRSMAPLLGTRLVFESSGSLSICIHICYSFRNCSFRNDLVSLSRRVLLVGTDDCSVLVSE
jgi:hypothetical protein